MATVSLQTVFDEARRALETDAADKAIGIAQHILVHFPRIIEGSQLLGEAYLNADQPEQAAAAFEHVLEADPENVTAYFGLGLAQEKRDQRPAAIAAFERALEIQPNLSDLRTQLMRLYAETPGSAGQFRLSRAGLGRLYSRGVMYGQAIDEYRAVLDSDPSRDDVKVALAEALWRDGQEDEAVDYCRDLLDRQPELHKPTVLLGYMLFASGQPEGEALWRHAAEQDPAMTTARSLFDILPPIRLEEPVLPEFDEAEWRAQSARRVVEQPTRQPVEQPVEAAAPVHAVEEDDDFFADSWLAAPESTSASSSASTYELTPEAAPAASETSSDDDALLASLLGFDFESAETPSEPEPATQAQTQRPTISQWDDQPQVDSESQAAQLPASLDDIGLSDETSAPARGEDIEAIKPFSLDDWGFDDEQGSSSAVTAPRELNWPESEPVLPENQTASASSDVQPFSLEEDNTVSGVEPFSLDQDVEGVKPFSLDEDAEAANIEPLTPTNENTISGVEAFGLESEAEQSTRSNAEESDLGLGAVQPFSLDDWGFDDESSQSVQKAGNEPGAADMLDDELTNFKPFSLDELAIDALEGDSDNALTDLELEDQAPVDAPSGFSWKEPSWRTQQAPSQTATPAQEDASIFAKLVRDKPQGPETSATSAQNAGDLGDEAPHYFSLDDESLRLDADQDQQALETAAAAGEGQQADEPGIVGKLVDTTKNAAGAFTDVAREITGSVIEKTPEVAGTVLDAAKHLVGKETEDEAEGLTEAEALQVNQAADELEAQIDAEGVRASSSSPTEEPSSLDELATTEGAFSWEETAIDQAETAEQDTVPFSLSDLGLSDDEIASLDSHLEAHEASAELGDEAEIMPFSLSELGLSDEEIAALDLGDDELETSTTGADDVTAGASLWSDVEDESTEDVAMTDSIADREELDTTPFSLAGLGLGEEELSFSAPHADQVAASQASEPASATYGDLSGASRAPAPEAPMRQEQPAIDDQAMPMDLPEGAQAAASSAEDQMASTQQPVRAASATSSSATIDPGLAAIQAQVAADPENSALRLAVARMNLNSGDTAHAVEQYKQLIKRGQLLDEVVVDLQDTIAEADDPQTLRRLHRLLGDAYMKQNRLAEAMNEYSWTFGRNT